jgi:CheY-like chemotaxis protein
MASLEMTAHAMAGDRERCLDSGMDGYISKPVRKEDLLEAIREFAGNAREPVSRNEIIVGPGRAQDPGRNA